MQTKLSLASVAAIAYQARAVTTTISSQAAETPAQSLINIYDNCKVEVSDASSSHYSWMDNKVQLRPAFTFSGIDTNCPDMTATVWFEPPSDCATTTGCDADGFTVTIPSSEITEGATYATTQTIDGITGEWYMHVTISPDGFDCALPITDFCMQLMGGCNPEDDNCLPGIAPQCEAHIKNFKASMANTYEDEEHMGEDALTHTLDWTIPSVWGCSNVCTTTYVRPVNEIGDVDGSRDWTEVKRDVTTNVIQQLQGATTYSKVNYKISVHDCDVITTIYDEETFGPVKPPNEPCSMGGTLEHVSVGHAGNQLVVNQQWDNEYTYGCRQYSLFAELENCFESETPYVSDQTLVFNDDQTYQTQPTGCYPDLTWENLPINVTSRVEVSGKWSTSDEEPDYVYHVDAYTLFNPVCNASPGMKPSFTYNIKDGKDIDSHKIEFEFSVTGQYSRFCPGFSGTAYLSKDGVDFSSEPLTSEQMLSLWHEDDSSDFTAPTIKLEDLSVAFGDGLYCVRFEMTPNADVHNMGTVVTTSDQVCHQINAKPCELTSKCSLSFTHDKDNTQYTFTQSAEADGNAWCDPENYDYTYRYKENDDEWVDALSEEEQPIRNQLEANQTTKTSWSMQETNIKYATEFQVKFNKKFTTQSDVTPEASTCFVDAPHYCRPSMLADPKFTFVQQPANLGLNVEFTDASQALDICGDMFVKVDVEWMSPEPIPEPNVVNSTTYTDKLPAAGEKITYDIQIPDEAACYEVTVTYGVTGVGGETTTRTSLRHCWDHICQLDQTALTYVSSQDDATQDSRQMAFKYDASWGKYCFDVGAQVCVTDKNEKLTPWCSEAFTVVEGRTKQQATSVKDQPVTVTQTADFDIAEDQEYTARIKVSDKGDHTPQGADISADTAVNFSVPLPVNCPADGQSSFTLDGYFKTDTLKTVTIAGALSGTSGAMCGAQTWCFNDPESGEETCSATLASGTWQKPSVTGDYTLTGSVKFSNSDTVVTKTWTGDWQQGCKVQISDATMVGRTRYDPDSDTAAGVTISTAGAIVGHCGPVVTVTGTLTGADGTVQSVNLDSTIFASETGVSANLQVDKYAQTYTWHVTVNAGQAPSINDHQALTRDDTGYIQVLSDTTQTKGECSDTDPSPCDLNFVTEDPKCNVVVEEVEITGFREKEACSDKMIATITGKLKAEISCNKVAATLKLKDDDAGVYVGNAVPTLVMNGNTTYHEYTFTQEIEANNEYSNYSATLIGYDGDNEADKDSKNSDSDLWEPLCCLSIPSFTKVSQTTSLDGLRTDLSYSVQLGQQGDQACRDSTAKISIKDGTGKNTFVHYLSEDDTKQALDSGFDFTASVDTTGSVTAVVDWTDSRAVDDQQATADGFVATDPLKCHVNIVDFCLDDGKEVSNGRWAFEFRIRAEANTGCGKMSVDLDLIQDDSNYLGHVSIPSDQIVDSFNCDCVKTFTVEADFNGASGDIYGQLDVRNSAHQVVQITDSCVYTVASDAAVPNGA